jgi:hypothetical protein
MNQNKMLIKGLLVLLLTLAFTSAIWAQATGSLVGNVTDKSGAVVPGAKVTLTSLGTNETKVMQSDPTGNYQFLQLAPGNYKLTVEKQGFEKFLVSSAQVAVGNASRVDVALQVGAETQTVEVSTQAELLSTQSSSLNYGVESKQVEQLPLNGRNVFNLAELVPGVVPQGSGNNSIGNAATGNVNAWGNYQIGGGTGNQSAQYIDGAPINASYANSAALVPNPDVIQEFQVATNNVSPEYGRFAGGVINMATKSGTNQFHGALYEYVRNNVLNANLYFDKRTTPVTPRPVYTQNQYGVSVGGPVIKDKAFFFLSWEQFDLLRATLTSTTVPTPQMLAGDFSQVSAQLYDPFNATCGTGGTQRCAYTAANGYGGTGPGQTPGAINQIPVSEINQAALNLTKLLFPPQSNTGNPSAGVNNFTSTVPNITDYNQYTARGDETVGKNKLFERFTDWHKNFAGRSALLNTTGTHGYFSTDQAVLGDTIQFSPTLIGDVRASFLRFVVKTIPLSCCNFNFGTSIGPGWANIQSSVGFPMLPEPNITGMNNFNTTPIILETDNAYVLSGAFTKIIGRHTIDFGGEMRKIEWDYAQSNSAGSTFNSPSSNGFTSSSTGSGGYGLASWLIGTATLASTQEPALSKGVMWYSGLYVNDSFRFTPKLTINAGVRWEQPGSFTETHGRLTTMLPTLPQTAISTAVGKTVTGGLALINSTAYPHNTWQQLTWKLFSPRVGFAYNPTAKWVFRGGFGIAYLPPTVSFSLGPYNNPMNLATTTINANGLSSPTGQISLTNPFPSGIAVPASGSNLQATVNALLGTGIQSPLPVQTYPYEMQWNVGFQRQLGDSASINVGYVGARGNHLPLYSYNIDQLPDQYNSLMPCTLVANVCQTPTSGQYLVTNPMSTLNGGPIPPSVGVLGAAKIQQAYLWKPNPGYQYMTVDSPDIGWTYYTALQVLAQKRFKTGGILSAAWTFSNLIGTADTLNAYLEESRFDVGGGAGVQDNTNINGNSTNPGERSRASFQTPNRLVINWVYPIPVGHGQRFLSDAHGAVDKIVGGWEINGLTTFQDGFPLAFQNSATNTLEANFAAGNAGPGLPAGVTRPDFVAGCNPKLTTKPSQRLGAWYNTACYTVPAAGTAQQNWAYGNEPRVDPYVRAQGIDTTDFSASKAIAISERFKLDFRAEFFNLFNWTQFTVPNDQVDNAASFGKVTAQNNQPRLIQFSGRFTF